MEEGSGGYQQQLHLNNTFYFPLAEMFSLPRFVWPNARPAFVNVRPAVLLSFVQHQQLLSKQRFRVLCLFVFMPSSPHNLLAHAVSCEIAYL